MHMQQHHPDLKLSLSCMEYGELRRAMEDGVVDIALAVNVNPSVSRNYRSTSIYQDELFAVMSRENPLAMREGELRLADLPSEKLLLPDSFVYAGLSDLIDGIMETQSQLVARAYYRDIDMLYLKVQTEGYVALSSSMNNVMFGDSVAIVPIEDIDSTFMVSAFYSDEIESVVYAKCREGFEACRDAIRKRRLDDAHGAGQFDVGQPGYTIGA